MFGLTSRTSSGIAKPAKKRTRFMTNVPEAKEELGIKCDGSHEHQQLVGGRAKKAEAYPEKLCKAICRAVVKTKARLSRNLDMVYEIDKEDTDLRWLLKLDKHRDDQGGECWTAWDDVNQVRLDPDEVKRAREDELGYTVDMEVFRLVDRSEAIKPVSYTHLTLPTKA